MARVGVLDVDPEAFAAGLAGVVHRAAHVSVARRGT
jgi:hypothetical protein